MRNKIKHRQKVQDREISDTLMLVLDSICLDYHLNVKIVHNIIERHYGEMLVNFEAKSSYNQQKVFCGWRNIIHLISL